MVKGSNIICFGGHLISSMEGNCEILLFVLFS